MKKNNAVLKVSGYRFAGVKAGIKASGARDLAVIVSQTKAIATAVFTKNRVQAAPVLWGKQIIARGDIQAVVVNAGNANAATGEAGYRATVKTAKAAAKLLKLKPEQILVSSTGKIGVPLPVEKIEAALSSAVRELSEENLADASEAICTTDRFPKVAQRFGKIGGKTYHVTGIAKGAGMIEPNMATMLAYVFTDLSLPKTSLKKSFREAVDQSFNAISVDGDCSTNDTALLLANGASGLKVGAGDAKALRDFQKELLDVCQELAWMMVADGEGATKLVELTVQGAKTVKQARNIAYTIARSQLVKTSFFGEDPNWGRIFAAIGYSGETLDPSRVDISYGKVPLLRQGKPVNLTANQPKAHQVMKNQRFSVTVDLHQGRKSTKIWTSDLTYDYVKINAEYST